MGWEFKTVEVTSRYNNRLREYRWESEDSGAPLTGWDNILAAHAQGGWDLVTACVDGYQENNTNMEATSFRLFMKRNAG